MIVNIAMRDENDHGANVSPLALCRAILDAVEPGAGNHCLQQPHDPTLGIYQWTHVRLGVTVVIDDRTQEEMMLQYPDRPTILMGPQ
jgi:hypothetical protein